METVFDTLIIIGCCIATMMVLAALCVPWVRSRVPSKPTYVIQTVPPVSAPTADQVVRKEIITEKETVVPAEPPKATNRRAWVSGWMPSSWLGIAGVILVSGIVLTAALSWKIPAVYDVVVGSPTITDDTGGGVYPRYDQPSVGANHRPLTRLIPQPNPTSHRPSDRTSEQPQPQDAPPSLGDQASKWWSETTATIYDKVIGHPEPDDLRQPALPPSSGTGFPWALPSLGGLTGSQGNGNPATPLHVWKLEVPQWGAPMPPYNTASALKITPSSGSCVRIVDESGAEAEICDGIPSALNLNYRLKTLLPARGAVPIRVAITECSRQALLKTTDPDTCN